MLKITLHDSANELRLQLEGKLSGAWVGELKSCWSTASSTTQGRRTVLDLREVDFVDPEGESLLREMCRAGAGFLAVSPIMKELVRQITGKLPMEATGRGPMRGRFAWHLSMLF